MAVKWNRGTLFSWPGLDAHEMNAHFGHPVVDHLPGILGVVACPPGIAVFGPLHPVRVRLLGRVLETRLALDGRVDDGETTGHDRVSAHHRVHVEQDDVDAFAPHFHCRGEARETGAHHDRVSVPGRGLWRRRLFGAGDQRRGKRPADPCVEDPRSNAPTRHQALSIYELSICEIEVTPTSCMTRRNSVRNRPSTCSTPAWPNAPIPHT